MLRTARNLMFIVQFVQFIIQNILEDQSNQLKFFFSSVCHVVNTNR